LSFQQVNGSDFSLPPAFDMKAFKAEILKEMRSEITKAKNEIIDGEYIYWVCKTRERMCFPHFHFLLSEQKKS
jgi:hypothetical protein